MLTDAMLLPSPRPYLARHAYSMDLAQACSVGMFAMQRDGQKGERVEGK